jgi:hypothetical protein
MSGTEPEPEPETECASCGTTAGPDRRARWESGCPRGQLGDWDRCERCGAPLCDSCALAGASHDCEALPAPYRLITEAGQFMGFTTASSDEEAMTGARARGYEPVRVITRNGELTVVITD